MFRVFFCGAVPGFAPGATRASLSVRVINIRIFFRKEPKNAPDAKFYRILNGFLHRKSGRNTIFAENTASAGAET